jgi:hypothetical protein
MASQPEMISTLERRYVEAYDRARSRGAAAQAGELESAVMNSHAVVSTSIEMARNLLEKDNALYSGYHLQVRAMVRQAASPENDSMRGAVDSSMYGSAADQITFCALSLDGQGLPSYGRCFLRLRDIAVEYRSTVLEENSYAFMVGRSLIGSRIPPGYLARWADRAKLAVAKLADRLTSATVPADFPDMILHPGPRREDDSFLEVHLFGPFNGVAIESVSARINKKDRVERALATWMREKLTAEGKDWFETDD